MHESLRVFGFSAKMMPQTDEGERPGSKPDNRSPRHPEDGCLESRGSKPRLDLL